MKTIEEIRSAKGYTQEFVAKMSGIAVSTYNQYERGARTVPPEAAERIAGALEVQVDDIFLPAKFTVRGREAV